MYNYVYVYRDSKGYLTVNDFEVFDDERVLFSLPGNRNDIHGLSFAKYAKRLIEYAGLRDSVWLRAAAAAAAATTTATDDDDDVDDEDDDDDKDDVMEPRLYFSDFVNFALAVHSSPYLHI